MIRVSTADPAFNQAYLNAFRALERELGFERPSQYGQRWRDAYRCRIDPSSSRDKTYYIFDHDEDYTWFMLRWA
jgi:hypothetical protein